MERSLISSVLCIVFTFITTTLSAQSPSETKPFQFCLMNGRLITPPASPDGQFKVAPSDKIKIVNLGKDVNTKGLDYAPVISQDGTTLYYVSDRDGSVRKTNGGNSHDIWALRLRDTGLNKVNLPYNLAPVPQFGEGSLNTARNEGVLTISFDRQRIYFTGCSRPDGKGDCDIYYSDIQPDGSWSRAVNCGNVNSIYFDSQPSISPDGKRLYFVSNRPHSRKKQTKAYMRAIDSLDNVIKELQPDLHMKALLLRRGIDTSKVEMDKYNSVIEELTDKHPEVMKEIVSLSEKIVKNERHDTGKYFNNNFEDLEQISMGLWFSEWNEFTETWDIPEELTALNTSGKDMSPFICNDNRTLIFASEGHGDKLGSTDLYITRQNEDGSWLTPVNFGAPINTKGEDMFIALPNDNSIAYFSSTRTDIKGAQGGLDLYMAYVIQDCLSSGSKATVSDVIMTEDSTLKIGYTMLENAVSLVLDVSKQETLTLKVFDIAGKEITTCIDKRNFIAGRHLVPLPLNNLAEGEYFFLLETNIETLSNGFVISR